MRSEIVHRGDLDELKRLIEENKSSLVREVQDLPDAELCQACATHSKTEVDGKRVEVRNGCLFAFDPMGKNSKQH